jgi:hypothetical protein
MPLISTLGRWTQDNGSWLAVQELVRPYLKTSQVRLYTSVIPASQEAVVGYNDPRQSQAKAGDQYLKKLTKSERIRSMAKVVEYWPSKYSEFTV